MNIVDSAANLLGISPGLIIGMLVAGVLLFGGWAVLRTMVRFTWRIFATGCLLMALLVGGFFVGAFLLNNLR